MRASRDVGRRIGKAPVLLTIGPTLFASFRE
jgi:hypothetical protein